MAGQHHRNPNAGGMGLPAGMQVPNLAAMQQMGMLPEGMGDIEAQQRRGGSVSIALNAIANRHQVNEDGTAVHAPFTIGELIEWARKIDDYVVSAPPIPVDDPADDTTGGNSGLVLE